MNRSLSIYLPKYPANLRLSLAKPLFQKSLLTLCALSSSQAINNMLGCRDNGGNIVVETMQELFVPDGQYKRGRSRQNDVPLPPSVYKRLTSSPTLMNLAHALTYHKMCYEEMPLQDLQATQEQQTIQNLSDTLRTILRL